MESKDRDKNAKYDITRNWIGHLRKEAKTSSTLACPLCKERRVQPNVETLWSHVLESHAEEVPKDDEEKESFRERVKSAATSSR
jgi:hypothetical protein